MTTMTLPDQVIAPQSCRLRLFIPRGMLHHPDLRPDVQGSMFVQNCYIDSDSHIVPGNCSVLALVGPPGSQVRAVSEKRCELPELFYIAI